MLDFLDEVLVVKVVLKVMFLFIIYKFYLDMLRPKYEQYDAAAWNSQTYFKTLWVRECIFITESSFLHI